MIRYAYSRKIPVQMFMCNGNDNVLNEKKFVADWRVSKVEYKVYPSLYPKDFEDVEEFVKEVKRLFEERFYEMRPIQ